MARTEQQSETVPVAAAASTPPGVRVDRTQMFPVLGHILNVSTPAGVMIWRVTKSSAHRAVIEPVPYEEAKRLVETVRGQRVAQLPWWKRLMRRR